MCTVPLIDELLTFGDLIGMDRTWFQEKTLVPHYDVFGHKVKQALEQGATMLSNEEFVIKVKNGLRHENKRK